MRSKKILIISGVYWSESYQRHQRIASYLARQGHEVLFLEAVPSSMLSFRKIKKRILVNKSVVRKNTLKKTFIPAGIHLIKLPFLNPEFLLYNKLILFLNKKKISKIDVIYSFLPIPLVFDILSKQTKVPKIIYDCVRDFEGWKEYSKNVCLHERLLLKSSDLLLVDSFFLKDKHKAFNPVQVLPTISLEIFREIRTVHKEIKCIKNIVYFGGFGDLLDLNLVRKLLISGFNLHVFGQITTSSDICSHPNFRYHGFISSEPELIKKIISLGDATIIPYKNNMDGVIPAKLIQSLLLPLPLFICEFYDSRHLSDYLYIYSDYEDLIQKMSMFSYEEFQDKRKNNISFVSNNIEEKSFKRINEFVVQS